MTTAVLTLTKSKTYRIDFFKNETLHDRHVWQCRTKVRDVLKQAGVPLNKQRPRTRWWPLYIGEQIRFVIDEPTNWFWQQHTNSF
jgi:hypothetical protein